MSGIAFLAVAPLTRPDRIETIACELRTMPSEEAYYLMRVANAEDVEMNG